MRLYDIDKKMVELMENMGNPELYSKEKYESEIIELKNKGGIEKPTYEEWMEQKYLEQAKLLDKFEGEFKTKLENIAKYVRTLQSDVITIDSEIKRLTVLKKQRIATASGISGVAENVLRTSNKKAIEQGGYKFETNFGNFCFDKSSIANVKDKSKLPEELINKSISLRGNDEVAKVLKILKKHTPDINIDIDEDVNKNDLKAWWKGLSEEDQKKYNDAFEMVEKFNFKIK